MSIFDDMPESFFSKINPCPITGCWNWSGSMYPLGYGFYSKTGYAHRFSFQKFNGPLIKGLTIDHTCRNRGCCNPRHLDQVSQKTNLLRSPITQASIRASKTHCVNGHPYSGSNLVIHNKRGRTPARECRICMNDSQRRRRAKLKKA